MFSNSIYTVDCTSLSTTKYSMSVLFPEKNNISLCAINSRLSSAIHFYFFRATLFFVRLSGVHAFYHNHSYPILTLRTRLVYPSIHSYINLNSYISIRFTTSFHLLLQINKYLLEPTKNFSQDPLVFTFIYSISFTLQCYFHSILLHISTFILKYPLTSTTTCLFIIPVGKTHGKSEIFEIVFRNYVFFVDFYFISFYRFHSVKNKK